MLPNRLNVRVKSKLVCECRRVCTNYVLLWLQILSLNVSRHNAISVTISSHQSVFAMSLRSSLVSFHTDLCTFCLIRNELHYAMAKLGLLIWPWHSEADYRPWTSFNGFKPTPNRDMTCTCDCIYSFNVFLTMGAESTRNTYSNLAVNSKYGCLKLRHAGYLIK